VSGVGRHGRDDHDSWDELAVGWALHALEPEDETLFAAHLADCRQCAQTVAETSEVMAAMAADLPQAEPSDGLRDRLRAAVEETEQMPPAQPRAERPIAPAVPAAAQPVQPHPQPQPGPALPPSRFGNLRAPLPTRDVDRRPAWRRVLPTALVAAAVAAVLSLGAWNVAVTGDRDAARATAAEQSEVLDSLLTPGRAAIAPVAQDGTTVATVVARDDQVQVYSTGLAVNDSHDSTYVLWGMVDGTVPRAIGTFDVTTAQTDLRTVGSSATGLDQYPAYAISIEPGRQAPSFPTDIIGQGQVTS
jgi:anti-sigma-K factor RskA